MENKKDDENVNNLLSLMLIDNGFIIYFFLMENDKNPVKLKYLVVSISSDRRQFLVQYDQQLGFILLNDKFVVFLAGVAQKLRKIFMNRLQK